MTIELTPDLEAGLARAATTRQFASADDYALRLLTDAAAQGCAELKAEADAAFLAKRDAYDKADPKATKELIEADAAKVEAVSEVVADPVIEK